MDATRKRENEENDSIDNIHLCDSTWRKPRVFQISHCVMEGECQSTSDGVIIPTINKGLVMTEQATLDYQFYVDFSDFISSNASF